MYPESFSFGFDVEPSPFSRPPGDSRGPGRQRGAGPRMSPGGPGGGERSSLGHGPPPTPPVRAYSFFAAAPKTFPGPLAWSHCFFWLWLRFLRGAWWGKFVPTAGVALLFAAHGVFFWLLFRVSDPSRSDARPPSTAGGAGRPPGDGGGPVLALRRRRCGRSLTTRQRAKSITGSRTSPTTSSAPTRASKLVERHRRGLGRSPARKCGAALPGIECRAKSGFGGIAKRSGQTPEQIPMQELTAPGRMKNPEFFGASRLRAQSHDGRQ